MSFPSLSVSRARASGLRLKNESVAGAVTGNELSKRTLEETALLPSEDDDGVGLHFFGVEAELFFWTLIKQAFVNDLPLRKTIAAGFFQGLYQGLLKGLPIRLRWINQGILTETIAHVGGLKHVNEMDFGFIQKLKISKSRKMGVSCFFEADCNHHSVSKAHKDLLLKRF